MKSLVFEIEGVKVDFSKRNQIEINGKVYIYLEGMIFVKCGYYWKRYNINNGKAVFYANLLK